MRERLREDDDDDNDDGDNRKETKMGVNSHAIQHVGPYAVTRARSRAEICFQSPIGYILASDAENALPSIPRSIFGGEILLSSRGGGERNTQNGRYRTLGHQPFW